MASFRSTIIVAGLLAAFSVSHVLPSSEAVAEEMPPVNESAPAASVPAPTGDGVETVKSPPKAKKKIVVKRKKSRKKKKAKKTSTLTPEASPGLKLTLNQVTELLKTTRDFSGKNLSGLQLVGMNLSKCNMKGVDLSHANLERADLEESSLDRADLTGTNLKMANLRLTGMNGTNLERAILDGALWQDGRVCAPGSAGQCRDSSISAPLR